MLLSELGEGAAIHANVFASDVLTIARSKHGDDTSNHFWSPSTCGRHTAIHEFHIDIVWEAGACHASDDITWADAVSSHALFTVFN